MSIPPWPEASTVWHRFARSCTILTYSSLLVESFCSMSTFFARSPLIESPRISFVLSRVSSEVLANLIPPAFPRPATRTWAFTTTSPPIRLYASLASSPLEATAPLGTGMPMFWASDFASNSKSFMLGQIPNVPRRRQ